MRDEPSAAAGSDGPFVIAVAAVFALAIGFAIGFLTSFTHALLMPWGIVCGAVLISAAAAGFRLIFESRTIGGAAGLGAFLGVGAATFTGAGGRVVGFTDPIDLIWLGIPCAVTVLTVVLPVRVGRRRRQKLVGEAGTARANRMTQ
ncbi:MAG TPA: hypothetical protein VNT53_04420 [Pseudolysinimonas sp.]|nr:hypothetical protein [Pseudolysinimonas sp.]